MGKHRRRASSPSQSVAVAAAPVVERWPWLALALIALAVAVAYFPVYSAGFVWDDHLLVLKNRLVQEPDGLRRIWFTTEAVDYWPVTNSTFWLEWRLWGASPLGYHVTNLLLHVVASVLVWRLLKELAIPGAAWAALLFAVHPVNVEAVAWIAQRKTVLAAVFYFLSLWAYARDDAATARSGEKSRGLTRWYALSLAAFLVGMLSKGSIAMLPLVLLLIPWFRRGGITLRDLWRVAPFLLIAVPLAAVNVWFQHRNAGISMAEAGLPARVAGAGAVVWFYLFKALVPVDLAFVYPNWEIDPAQWQWWLPLLAAALVTGALVVWRNGRWGRPLLFGWAYYGLSLVPVLGLTYITLMEYTRVADHYQYLALVAVVALVAAGLSFARDRAQGAIRTLLAAAPAGLAVILAVLCARQAATYHDEVTVWQAALKQNPDAWVVNYSLGAALVDANDSPQAIGRLERARQLRPNEPKTLCDLSSALLNTGRPQVALELARQAVQLAPELAAAHYNVGSALLLLGQPQDAADSLNEALRREPDYVEATANLAAALAALNRSDEAIAAAQKAIDLARRQGNPQKAQQIEAWLTRYRAPRG